MMRFFIGLIATIFIFQLTAGRAQALGQQCCPDGRTWFNGQCRLDAKEACLNIMAPACFAVTQVQSEFPQIRGQIIQMCVSGGIGVCEVPAVVGANLAQGANGFCPVLVVEALKKGNLVNIAPPQVANIMNQACLIAFNTSAGLDSFLVDSACSDTETCVGNVCYEPGTYFLCNQATDQYKGKCEQCLQGGGIWTAIGCVEHSAQGITNNLLKVGLGIAGGLALLMILVAAFEFSVSQGDPKLTNEAKERLQAAVIGLLFIIFSVTILQFMGVTILHIPGFGV